MKKNIGIFIYSFIIVGAFLLFLNSCKKDSTVVDPPNTVRDIDGNLYHTITIGSQVWMLENLKVTHYRNGNPIPDVTVDSLWSYLTTGAYCNYENNPVNSTTYGRLYNFYAVNDPRKICPTGWHIPNDSDWTILASYLGGNTIAGGKLKEADVTHWQNPNVADNLSGFTALPGGVRSYLDAQFCCKGTLGYWWSSTTGGSDYGDYISLTNDNTAFEISYRKRQSGYSVRCLHD